MQQTPGPQPTKDHRAKLADLMLGFVPAQAINTAAELGIPDLIAHEAKTAEELAAATHAHPRTLFRLLRYLASIGVFQADSANRFGLTPLASLLCSDAQGSMRSMSRIMGRAGPRTSNHLIDAVRSDRNPYELAFGRHR